MDTYHLLKFVHIVSVVLWVGGSFTLAVVVGRAARPDDRALLSNTLRQAAFYGRAVSGPASLLTLLTGMGMLLTLGISAEALWVRWGFVGMLVHIVLGATVLRRAMQRLLTLAAAPETAAEALNAAVRRLVLVNAAYLAMLLSVVGAMAIKPVI